MRTRQDVIEARKTVVGCCSRFADNMACDCLEEAEGDAAPCLTPAEVDDIEVKVAELYRLYNRCHEAGCRWESPHPEVHELMRHLDRDFPGYYALQLIAEVRWLQRRVLELTRSKSGGAGHEPVR